MISRSRLGWLLWIAIASTTWASAPPTQRSDSGPSAAGVRDFASGVRIDWRRGVVEVDVEVVLRTGPLELLACSPRTREHESILAVRARPMHIYQAMGLVGMKPGSPTRYDEAQQEWLAPSGDALELRIRIAGADSTESIPVENWLLDVTTNRPPKSLDWVFAGSLSTPSGRFGADSDGTVVCVVDFETALITVAARHSADNDRLWLAANTKAIPPVATTCTLLISHARPVIYVDVARDGTLRRAGEVVSVVEIAKSAGAGGRVARCVLRCGPGVAQEMVDRVVASLVKQGIALPQVVVERNLPAKAILKPPETKPTTKIAPG